MSCEMYVNTLHYAKQYVLEPEICVLAYFVDKLALGFIYHFFQKLFSNFRTQRTQGMTKLPQTSL